jgi:hypothetical protein
MATLPKALINRPIPNRRGVAPRVRTQAVALIAQLREPQVPHQGEKWQFVMSPLPGTGITVLLGA